MITTVTEYAPPRFATGGIPVVTAIIIFLNSERFLEEAIESIFDQSYEDWELLLVDDGSTDASTHIARGYADKYPQRVRYLEHPGHANRGMSASRNLGMRHSTGEFLAFLDADDVWRADKLEQQLDILNSHPEAAMVYGATQYWFSWTGKREDAERDYVPDLGVRPGELVRPPALVSVLLENQIATSTGCLIRREAMLQVGGYEESFPGMFEDQVFQSKVSLSAPVFVSGECWYKYRRHADSCCSVAERAGTHHAARLTFLSWLENYCSTNGVDDRELRLAIRKQRWKSGHPVLSRRLEYAAYRATLMKEGLKSIARRVLPVTVYRRLRAYRRGVEDQPPVGSVRFGDLRRVTPISRVFGFDRGTPVDRYYIENFLAGCAGDIRGRVLEAGDDTYTRRFGGDGVTRSDVMHVSEQNPRATIIADLANAHHIPSDAFDCIVLTQTLHLIYDVRAAISTLHRILRPGGVLLTTFPGISQIDHYEWGESWYWAFTARSARRLFEEAFAADGVTVETHGNVFAATAFLQGIALEELRPEELDHNDPDYQVTIAVRAVKEGRAC